MADFYLDQKTGLPVVLPKVGPWVNALASGTMPAPTGGGTLSGNYTSYRYRQVGDAVEVDLYWQGTVAGSGSSAILFPLPLSLTATGFIPNAGTVTTFGVQHTNPNTSAFVTSCVETVGAGSNGLALITAGSSSNTVGSAVVSSSSQFRIKAVVPVQQWVGMDNVAYGAGLASVSGTTEKSGLIRPRKGSYSPTLTSGATITVTQNRFIYYQDQDGNHRVKFNVRVSVPSGSRTGLTITASGVTFKNTPGGQAIAVSSTVISNGFVGANSGDILAWHATASTTNEYLYSGDVELESKPTWA